MCGIAGWLGARGRRLPATRFAAALDRLRHRGPDDEGFLSFNPENGEARAWSGPDTIRELELPAFAREAGESPVLLGHRRLSIIDLTAAGHQPMKTADDRYWIVYNGEIYNYIEMRHELESLGARFRTQSDTEVLLQGFVQWGPAVLEKAVGMFAFAVLDTVARTLFLARDHFGIKPLYYVRKNEFFAFASEIKALLELPGVSRTASAQDTYQFLRFGERSANTQTILNDIQQLPAASWTSIDLATLTMKPPQQFWKPEAVAARKYSFGEATDALRHELRESMRLHMRSDVPIGACLSGGLDSTTLCELAKHHLTPAHPLRTFSFISEDIRFSEEPYVDMVEGVIREKTRPNAAEFAADLTELMETQDLPFMNLGVYAQFRVFRLAHEHGIKVMLDGQGSDEIFGGYGALMGAKLTSMIARGRLIAAAQMYRQLPDTVPNMRRRTGLLALGRLLPNFMQMWAIRLADSDLYPGWLNASWFEAHRVKPAIRLHGRGANAFREELILAIKELTLPQLLRYEDGSSMHFSIESRVPFCTPRIAELALSLPEEHLMSADGETKRVLRSAAEGLVPEPIIRREKLGFHAPDRLWLRSARGFVDELLQDYAPRNAPFLDHEGCRKMIDEALRSDGYWPPHVWGILGLLAWSRHNQVEFG
jgi:asparagine synthase (glutamine-hydrolysing)